MERILLQKKQLHTERIQYDQFEMEVRERELNAEAEAQKQQLNAP